MANIPFEKYEATGNDFIVIDCRPDNWRFEMALKYAHLWCDRHFGIGADGILAITAPHDPQNHAYMHVINSDGSVAAMCGNGIRCVAAYLNAYYIPDGVFIETDGGLQTVRYLTYNAQPSYEVTLAKANILAPCDIPQNDKIWHGIRVDVGNPHCVFETPDPSEALAHAGEFLSNHETFPDRSNIEFIRERAEDVIDLTVYERGAGPTLACGTGCVAAAKAYAHARKRADTTIEIHAPGGILYVHIPKSGAPKLIGPASYIFSGSI
ncbi:MAG: diaminopimelate epimerase [Proteobacteria bacterium]|nr:diaminopimelate epimerase [Pseudomonadota bacterium]